MMTPNRFQDTDLSEALPELARRGLTPLAYLDNGEYTDHHALLVARSYRGELLLGEDEGCMCCGHAPFAFLDDIDFEAFTPAKWASLGVRVREVFADPSLAPERAQFLVEARAALLSETIHVPREAHPTLSVLVGA